MGAEVFGRVLTIFWSKIPNLGQKIEIINFFRFFRAKLAFSELLSIPKSFWTVLAPIVHKNFRKKFRSNLTFQKNCKGPPLWNFWKNRKSRSRLRPSNLLISKEHLKISNIFKFERNRATARPRSRRGTLWSHQNSEVGPKITEHL